MQSLSIRTWLSLVLLVGACNKDSAETEVPSSSSQIPPTTILEPTFAENSGVTENVLLECNLQEKVPAYIVQAAPSMSTGDSTEEGQVLALEITQVIAPGGGAWTGPKSLMLAGILTANNQVIGTFEARRSTSGGAFGGYKGTCSFLMRNAKTLGKDIAGFLANPSMNARLGELR